MQEPLRDVYALDDMLAAGGPAPGAQSPSLAATPRPVAVTPDRDAIKPMDGHLQRGPRLP